MTRRGKTQIRLGILDAVHRGNHIATSIVYRCNLSFQGFERHMAVLLRAGLVENRTEGNRRLYFLTDAGRRVLEASTVLNCLLEAEERIDLLAAGLKRRYQVTRESSHRALKEATEKLSEEGKLV